MPNQPNKEWDWEKDFRLRMSPEIDSYCDQVDSPLSERVYKFISETIASHNEALIADLEGMKCTGTMKDLPEMREFNYALDKAISLIKNSEGKETV